MPNPMFNTAMSPNKATAPNNSVNDSKRTFTVGRNTFDYSRPHYLTARYADITPFECIHAVEGDVLELGSKHEIRSHTLKSPLMSDIYMKKTYVQVDMKAILPRNWNRFYINPTNGDDVNSALVNTYCDSFFKYFGDARVKLANLASISRDQDDSLANPTLDFFFHYLLVFEHVFSSGSLLNHLGFHSHAMCRSSFDREFERLVFRFGETSFKVFTTDGEYVFNHLQYHDLFSLLRYNHHYHIMFNNYDVSEANEIFSAFAVFFENISFVNDLSTTPLNYSSLCAYQIACATFYSRDSLDVVFSAETYRDVMDSLWRTVANYNNHNIRHFEYSYNGQYYTYDALSGSILHYILYNLFDLAINDGVFSNRLVDFYEYKYFMNLFGFNESLRFGDYFTGSKPRPLAVGDVTAEVNNGAVNAIDMTVALARARFLNDVNRVGRRPEDYIDDITDGELPPEITEPRFLASVTSRVSGFEVENTSEDQGNIVTILKSGDSNKIYSLNVGHPCIIIGLLTFEIPRIYARTIDRFFFHEDRFDMFNKYLQRIGDQSVLKSELDASNAGGLDSSAFSYTLRNMEYKQRFPVASGGFVDFLPGYLFITDSSDSLGLTTDSSPNISPEFLRSKNNEIDKFYSSLTNYSLGGYFHFILGMKNICIAHRKMDYTPSIL